MTANLPGLKSVAPPPLESGDRLSRSEFERRFATADVTKAELIEGVVYVASPLRFSPHAEPHSRLVTEVLQVVQDGLRSVEYQDWVLLA